MTTVPRRYMLTGRNVARRVYAVLSVRGLQPHFSDWVLTAHNNRVWLFGVLDIRRIGRLERYTDTRLIHHLSTACDGVPVFLSNTNGLRYAFLLSQRPKLPRMVEFPGYTPGVARLGVGLAGQQIAARWSDLGHVLVAGKTGAGKSSFLRLLAYQSIRDGALLLLSDLDGTTFPMLNNAPMLLAAIANTPEDAHSIVARGLAECDRRAALYHTVPGHPDDIDEYNSLAVSTGRESLPRLLVVLDEFNATVTALGGHRGQFARDAAQLGWRGRKFGVNLVFAAQDFAKSVVGRVRDQVTTAVCFRVRSAETARNVGCAGAHRIPEGLPGRAMTDRWGTIQTYYLGKGLLGVAPSSPLEAGEEAAVRWAIEHNDGYLSLGDIQARMGLGMPAARRLALDWERRGWLMKDPHARNKRRVTGDLAALVTNRQSQQTRAIWQQTDKPAPPTADKLTN